MWLWIRKKLLSINHKEAVGYLKGFKSNNSPKTKELRERFSFIISKRVWISDKQDKVTRKLQYNFCMDHFIKNVLQKTFKLLLQYFVHWLCSCLAYKGTVANRKAVTLFLLTEWFIVFCKLLQFFQHACLDSRNKLCLKVAVYASQWATDFFKKTLNVWMNFPTWTLRQQELKTMLFFFGKFTFLCFCSNASQRIPWLFPLVRNTEADDF